MLEAKIQFVKNFIVTPSGCIGAGIDCNDVHLVARMEMPTSIIHLIQEMDRCGRMIGGDIERRITDPYHIKLNLKDFVYLNEHLYYDEDTLSEDTNLPATDPLENTILSQEEE